MSWFRFVSKLVFRKYEGIVNPEKAQSYMAAARYGYFFTATSLFFYVYYQSRESQRIQNKEEEERKKKQIDFFGEPNPGNSESKVVQEVSEQA